MISKPNLPFLSGYIEVEIDGVRTYKNAKTGMLVTQERNASKIPLSHEQINVMVVEKIRERYDVNEEFKMINLGIADSNNEDYIAYREYVQKCIDWGNALEEGGD